jgi:hypothetical protein
MSPPILSGRFFYAAPHASASAVLCFDPSATRVARGADALRRKRPAGGALVQLAGIERRLHFGVPLLPRVRVRPGGRS